MIEPSWPVGGPRDCVVQACVPLATVYPTVGGENDTWTRSRRVKG